MFMEAVRAGCMTFLAKGTAIKARMTAWTVTEISCTRLYCLFLAQSGFTGTGLLVSFRGGSLGGAIRSRRLRQKTRYSGGRSSSMLESAARTLGVVTAALRLSRKRLFKPSV